MPEIVDKELYDIAKQKADEIYKHPSAYKSGYIVHEYKKMFHEKYGDKVKPYKDDHKEKNLKRWYDEKWTDIGNKEYPVYRPTIRRNEHTPLTVDELDKKNLQEQIKLKQKIKGDSNLPPFKANDIYKYSNPKIVFKKAKQYLGRNVIIRLSDKPQKKYMIYNPIKEKWVYFGHMGYEDFTRHGSLTRRENYLRRTANMRGNWKDDPYSSNNMSRILLWNA